MILTVMWLMTALVIGFMVGRISMYGAWGTDEEEMGNESGEAGTEGKSRRRRHSQEERGQFWSVGSPLSGEVIHQEEGDHPTVVIHPDEGRLYAPADGRISRLFPMGNSFLFTTDFGTELYIQAGAVGDDLLSEYYRPKVLQNEVVGKGKLLLEFDKEGLEAEGISAEVSVCVENCFFGSEIRMAAGERVVTGEEILQVREPMAEVAVTAG